MLIKRGLKKSKLEAITSVDNGSVQIYACIHLN